MELAVEEEIKNKSSEEIDYLKLEKLQKKIEKLDKNHHIKIASIFKENNISLNENNNGIFINLNELPETIIKKIEDYLAFINMQENFINNDEKLKRNLENTFFKDNKEIDKL